MSEIKFMLDLGGRQVEASILDPTSERTVPDQRGCPECGGDAYFSGCTAPNCNGWGCPDCSLGCDLDFVDAEEGGRCASAVADEGLGGDCE